MPRIIHPLSEPSDGLFENNPDKTSIEQFKFFHADEGKPLATPWQVALSRAIMLRDYQLPEGVILDCACGSGIQIAAYSEILKRPIVGVELNENRARASAVNFRTVFTERGNDSLDRLKNSAFIVGDGRNGSEIMSLLNLENESVAFLHLDPARPRNSRAHALSEMAPRLDEVFAGWKPHLKSGKNGPAMLLDLSPRLSSTQMLEVEELVETFWPNTNKTWTWTSRGRGRVDRLALWLGAIAETTFPRRFVRIPPDPTSPPFILLGGKPVANQAETPEEIFIQPQRGNYASIIDAALVESGMANDWLETVLIGDYVWAESQGRRPVIYHQKSIEITSSNLANLIVATGRIVDLINAELTIESVDEFVEICLQHDIGKLTIRASLDPNLQPKLQGSFDRQLARRHGSREAFLLRNPKGENYLLCVKN